MKGLYWSSLSLISASPPPRPPSFFPFPSVAKRGNGSGGSYEKVSLWIRMVKHGAPRWGAAWTITAAAAALQTWYVKGLPLQTCQTPLRPPHPSETLLPPNCRHLMRAQNYWLSVESTWGTQRDAPALPESSLKSFLNSRPPGWMRCETEIDFQDEDIELLLARGSNSYQSDSTYRF